MPFLLLVVLELALRAGHYGYPTTFFVRERIGAEDFYVPNDHFGYRFFPATIARTPFALRMPVKKPANIYRIFVFGESAAQGDPDPTFGVSRYLETLLRQRFPGRDFEVVCVAMTAINSHAILPIARECASLDGDLWIIYMGNNEMVGPYGAATVFGPKAPPLKLVRASVGLKSLRLGQLIERTLGKLRKEPASQKIWSGLDMFKENQLYYRDPGRLRAQRNFAGNLESILDAGHRAGVPVLLSTVACNLRDCPPFASLHRPGLREEERSAWEQQFNVGVQSQKSGDFKGARDAFAKAAEMDGEYAELQFHMAQCDVQLTNLTGAKREFELARDYDALAFRADSPINSTITNAARRRQQERVVLVNAVEDLGQNCSSRGNEAEVRKQASEFSERESLVTSAATIVFGEDLFYEHVHLNFDGNYRLARVFAEQILQQLPPALTNHAAPGWASMEVCERALAVSPWDRYRVWQANFSRVSEPPFTGQMDDAARARRFMARLEQLRAQMTAEAQAQTRNLYQEALRAAPEDVHLHGNFAQILGELGDFAAAVKEQRRVCELLPQLAPAFHKAGLLLVRQNEIEQAAIEFRRGLALRPDYVPAINELGVILANEQKTGAAEEMLNRAIELNPGYVESHINLGFTKQSAGKMQGALAEYGRGAELQPEGPAGYFSKAVALANEGQSAGAVRLFQAAVWMNPTFWQARYLLGVELARVGQAQDAETQFAEVVRLRPDMAKAHMNLGVALAKRGKLDEALAQFETASKLNPTNEAARQNVEKVRAVMTRRH